MADKRRGLANSIALAGKGVHTGQDIRMVLRPPETDEEGIIFVRTDLGDKPLNERQVHAHYGNVVDTKFCTTISNDHGVTLATIEHLMAAFAGCGVDDVVVEIDGAEIPVMDGSSHIFVEAIKKAGIKSNGKYRKYIRVLAPVSVEAGDSRASLLPADEFEMDVSIDFSHQLIGQQRFRTAGQNGCWPVNFDIELASARTFGFVDDLDRMRDMGLARGASLDNTIAIMQKDEGSGFILNQQGLRFDNEFVRHKALDAVGDLALAGAPLIGRFESHKAGHALNNQLLRALFSDPDNFQIESADQEILVS